jgi:single-strand DNA-binding protein
MGRSVNKVQIIGTLGRDPEMKFLPNGNAVVTVSVATDESYNDKNSGQKVEKTEWHRLTAFGKLAEIVGQYLKKGSKAYFEGKLKTNEYEKDGIKRYSTEIVVNDMMMLDGRQDSGQGFANTQPMVQSPSAAMGQQPPAQQPQQGFAQPQGQQPPAQQPQQGFAQPHGQQPPAQQPQQGYSQPQQPARQPQQGGFAPQQAAPQQGGFAPQQAAPQQATQPNQGYSQPQHQPAPQPQAAPQPANNFDSFDDDIPF